MFRIACCELSSKFHSFLCFGATKDSRRTAIADNFKDPVVWLPQLQKLMVLPLIPPHNNMGFREKKMSAYLEQRDVLFRDYLLPAEKFSKSEGNFFVG